MTVGAGAATLPVDDGAIARRLPVLAILLMLDNACYAAVAPLLPTLRSSLGLSSATLGFIVACYSLGLVVCALPCGRLALRLGPRIVVLAGALVLAASGLMLAFADSAAGLVVARLLQGAAAALTWSGALAWVASSTSLGRQGAVIGTILSAAVTGKLLGPGLGWLAVHTGRGSAFVTVAVLAVLATFSLLLIPSPARVTTVGGLDDLLVPARTPITWVFALLAVVMGAYTVWMPLRLDELGAGAGVAAGCLLAVGLLQIVGGPLAGAWADRAGIGSSLRVAFAVVAVAMLVFAFATRAGVVVAVAVASMACAAIMLTPVMAGINRAVASRGLAPGAVSGSVLLFWAVGEVVGASLAGATIGSWRTVTAVVLALAFLGLQGAVHLLAPGPVTGRRRAV
ncbi:MFS transporter [Nocardioides sp. GY 10127]|uniref:MFS transporter n=1 Tax=Nocardioides sp. GY 10127 TaxID=2569762 RepID=UPI0010A7ADC9|nr:MFS transporter [Nocardioides sp. GY 10127]TIC80044.1 MFS transporter [Nocardioides sp. GY 10127]